MDRNLHNLCIFITFLLKIKVTSNEGCLAMKPKVLNTSDTQTTILQIYFEIKNHFKNTSKGIY